MEDVTWLNTEVRIKGRKENVEKCINIINNSYFMNYDLNGYKMIKTIVDGINISYYGMISCATILCKYPYNKFLEREIYFNNNGCYMSLSLLKISEICNINIEIWLNEIDSNYQEHYYINDKLNINDKNYYYENKEWIFHDEMNTAKPNIIEYKDLIKLLDEDD